MSALQKANAANVALPYACLPAMTQEAIERVRQATTEYRKHPQLPFKTQHILHAGMYVRTVVLFPGEGTGVLVKIPTVLILCGEAEVFTGYETVRISGYAVLPAMAGRKQAFRVFDGPLFLTMMFPTAAKTVEEAEAQFTDEIDLVCPFTDTERHQIIITGD